MGPRRSRFASIGVRGGARLDGVAALNSASPRRLSFNSNRTKLAVCRLNGAAPIPEWATAGPWWSVSHTQYELSIVCEDVRVPEGVAKTGPWRALQVVGPLDHQLVGILASITAALATSQVPIFVLSAFDTEWVLVPEDRLERACCALVGAGHEFDP